MFWWYAARLNNTDNNTEDLGLSCRNTAQKVLLRLREINTFIQKRSSDQITRRDANEPMISRSARAEDEDGDDGERVYLREAEIVFSASPPRASERLPRAAAAGQRVSSVQPIRSRPRSISINHEQNRRCNGASWHSQGLILSCSKRLSIKCWVSSINDPGSLNT